MINCKNCNSEVLTFDTKKYPKIFCSYSCYEKWNKFNKPANTNCKVCNTSIYIKPYQLKRSKNITCSIECSNKLRTITMLGSNNHQFGLIGHNNSSFKNRDLISNYGYVLEYCPGHPRPYDNSVKGTRVRQHRLVVERNSHLFDDKYFEIINGWKVLKKEYDVHHKNENKTDNRIENLEILLRGEHTKLHNQLKNANNTIIGVFKSDELLETPEVDNQQPS